jgi:hypothetical protein
VPILRRGFHLAGVTRPTADQPVSSVRIEPSRGVKLSASPAASGCPDGLAHALRR